MLLGVVEEGVPVVASVAEPLFPSAILQTASIEKGVKAAKNACRATVSYWRRIDWLPGALSTATLRFDRFNYSPPCPAKTAYETNR